MPRYTLDCDISSWLSERTVYAVLAGSRCQGLSSETSDYDIKGVFIPPREYFYSPFLVIEQAIPTREHLQHWLGSAEGVEVEGYLWSIIKFASLAADGNPQILEVLFVSNQYVLKCDPIFGRLVSYRDCFLSESIREKFLGYTKKALKKLRRHKKWLTNPLKAKPTREAYGISRLKMPKDKIRGCRRLPEDDTSVLPEAIHDFLQKEKRYLEGKREWDAYQVWLASRNTRKIIRGELFGYDPKIALNAIRYPRMASEILSGKGFIVERSEDREELLEIKCGLWEYDRIISCIENEIERLASIPPSPLMSKTPDVETISAVLSEVINQYLS